MKAKEDKKHFDCVEVEKKIHKFLDGQLDNNELVLFEDHLTNCLPCDKKIEFEKKLLDLVKSKSRTEAQTEKLLNDFNAMIARDKKKF